MKVLLTGANGHLGSNTARALIERGHAVVAFVRPTADLRGLTSLQLTYAQGVVTDAKALTTAAEGCDAIIHCAAVYNLWAKDPATIEQPALVGTQNIINAAKTAGVKRLVYTSSSWAIGLTDDPAKPLTAADWNEQAHNPYGRAKVTSERKAWELANQAGVPMIALCPGGLLGAYDYRITPSNQLVLGMADGSGSSFNAGIAMIDVRDAALIHALAVDQGEPGQRYAITQSISFRELAQLVTDWTGKKVRHIGAPLGLIRLAGGVLETVARFTGKPPQITRALVDDMGERYMYIDSGLTWATFAHQPIPLREAVRATLAWLIELGKLKPGSLRTGA